MQPTSELPESLKQAIRSAIGESSDPVEFLNRLRDWLHDELSPLRDMPVDRVRWVPVDRIVANDYNPNSVARNEMRLLYVSIEHDGYTQPIVTFYDDERDRYVVVDGFHRYTILRYYRDIAERTGGRLPVVVIDKPLNDRMASTVRHNRARGRHSVRGMANIVFGMLDGGWSDADICNQLGIERDELIRLKHITGFSKLFESAEYQQAWETMRQIRERRDYQTKAQETGNDGESPEKSKRKRQRPRKRRPQGTAPVD